MQVERENDPQARLVLLRVRGAMTDRDLLDLVEELRRPPEPPPDVDLLIDLLEADGRSITAKGVRALAHQPLALSAESRCAVIVPSNLGFGMARMYEIHLDGRGRGGSFRVFRDAAEGRRWLAEGGRLGNARSTRSEAETKVP